MDAKAQGLNDAEEYYNLVRHANAVVAFADGDVRRRSSKNLARRMYYQQSPSVAIDPEKIPLMETVDGIEDDC